MFKHKTDPDPSANQIDPQIIKMMGPLPEEANPGMPTETIEPQVDVQPVSPASPPLEEVKDQPIEAPTENVETPLTTPAIPPKPEPVDDLKTDAAVRDIVAHEGDELLQVEDDKANAVKAPKKHRFDIKAFFSSWWHNRLARNITIIALILIALAVALIPVTRYSLLNVAGVRSRASLQVIDAKSGLPIKNVEVTAGGQTANTDTNGKVSLSNVRLGTTTLTLKKRSFATLEQKITIGWGSNPYADPFQITPVGSQYNFVITDWLSGKAIEKAQITDGDSTALTDNNGKATLTFQPTDSSTNLTIKADGYRNENTVISASDKTSKSVALVPARPDVFISKRSGKYDLYKKDVDGKNETLLLTGTGQEQGNISLLTHPTDNVTALASSRKGQRDSDGYLLSNLYIDDLSSKALTEVDSSAAEQIQLINWVGDKLIFVKIVAGPSAGNSGREQVISYDYKQDKQTVLASANYFNDVEVINGHVYYAPSSSGDPAGSAQLFQINPDGSGKTSLLNKETWVLYRTAYNIIQISAANNSWYQQDISTGKVTAMSGSPASPANQIFIDSPDGNSSVWLDNRDGQGVLILHDNKTGVERTLFSKAGLNYPINWLSDKHLLVRVSNNQETADYVLNTDGGTPKKVSDVTNTYITNRWYYYQ